MVQHQKRLLLEFSYRKVFSCVFCNKYLWELLTSSLSCFAWADGVQNTYTHVPSLLYYQPSSLPSPPLLPNAVPLSLTYTHMCNTKEYICCCCCKSLWSCPTLCDPIDGSPSGSSFPGILQAKTLEWAAVSFYKSIHQLVPNVRSFFKSPVSRPHLSRGWFIVSGRRPRNYRSSKNPVCFWWSLS